MRLKIREPWKEYDHTAVEDKLNSFWSRTQAYKQVRAANKEGEKFYFVDGPPFTTGSINLGTAKNKILKDSIIRYMRLQGFDVRDQPGFDMHGLPIEVEVESSLGITDKKGIEDLGSMKFPKRWKKDHEPWRKLILWGTDNKGNPSFAILFGKHHFMGIKLNITDEDIEEYLKSIFPSDAKYKPEIKAGIYEVLQDNVKFDSYVVWRGKNGHLPSFYPIKIVQERKYDYKKKKYITSDPALYYKKDVEYRWGYRVDKEKNIPVRQAGLEMIEGKHWDDAVKIFKGGN